MDQAKQLLLAALNQYRSSSWHPSLADAVSGLTVEQALWRPGPGLSCIWEQVSHMIAWTEELASRLAGNPPRAELYETTEAGWLAPPPGAGESEWQALVGRLQESHEALARVAASLDADALVATNSNTRTTPALNLLGCLNHASYHGAQIILLRRLQGIWEPEG